MHLVLILNPDALWISFLFYIRMRYAYRSDSKSGCDMHIVLILNPDAICISF